MQLKKFLRLYKNLILMTVWLLCSVAGLLFGVVPLAQKAVSLGADVRTLSAEVDLLRSRSAILNLLDENTLRRNVLTLATAVPPDKSLPTILTTIDTVSGGSGIDIIDVSLTNPGSLATASAKKITSSEAKIGSNVLPFSVSGRGTWEQAKSFLSSVVSVRRMFRLRSMDISLNSDVVSVRADLDAFYFPYPTTVGTAQTLSNLTDEEEKTIASVETLPLDSVGVVSTASTAATSVPSGKSDPFSP